jgi:NADH-quinone oxidoreductase subunit J
VHAVLHLMLAFSQAAGLWLLLKAEFLAIALVLVYLGAVMVLFLFVVMMLDIDVSRRAQGFLEALSRWLLLSAVPLRWRWRQCSWRVSGAWRSPRSWPAAVDAAGHVRSVFQRQGLGPVDVYPVPAIRWKSLPSSSLWP